MPLDKLNVFTKKVQDLADKPNATMTASQVKAQFDAAPEELRLAFNQLIDDFGSAVDGDSGADNIAVTAIAGLTGVTVQSVLESLKALDDTNRAYLLEQIQTATLGQIPDGTITAVKLSTDAKQASNITVEDAGNHFTGANVETVLNELFTFANDGKTTVATAVTAKGVTASPTDTFSALATKIGQISTGKKWASGTVTSGSTVTNFQYAGTTAEVSLGLMSVNGLSFKPSHVYAVYFQNATTIRSTVYSEIYDGVYGKTAKVTSHGNTTVSATAYNLKGDVANASVFVGGFNLPVTTVGVNFTWIAFE